ncbi:SLAM family member 9-like [Hemitrygon akajei]|uniref:SLAM family member 9-like n=2 Tax=Hemitrygon akajei TaxID=2704970 RepID=UPI003BFA33B9
MNSPILLLVLAVFAKITWEEEIKLVSAPGDSVWFPGVDADQRRQIGVFQWKKVSRNDTKEHLKPILKFHKSSKEPALIQNYSGRITFSTFNGSFAIHNITREDEGLYRLFINLKRVAVQAVWVRVIDKLSAVSLRSNSSSLGDTIKLSCNISGYPHQYQWRKDGGGINPRHQLVKGNGVLVIPGASSDDCGTYTCIATNPVSSVQISHSLTIYGIPPDQIMVIMLGTAGLLFFGVNVLGSIAFCTYKCMSEQESRGKLYLFLMWMISWHIPSLLVIQLALISWSIVGGIVTLPIIILFAASLLLLFMPILGKINSGLGHCVSVAVPLSGLVMICLSNYILKAKFHQLNKGCHSRTLTWGTFLASTAVIGLIHSVFFAVCHYHRNKAQTGDSKQLIGETHDLETESSYEVESKKALVV